jgi:MATE family multidrug resistance protein
MPFRESKETLKLALPIMLGSASQILMGVVDSLMIGAVGTVPLAASAFAGGVFSFFYVVGLGLLMPISVLVARTPASDGEGPHWLRHGMLITVGASLLGCLLMLGLLPFLPHFDQPAEVLEAMHPFYELFAASLVPALLYHGLKQYAEARGEPWTPMLLTMASVGLNVVLNWILIFGNLGAPALGLTGAGLSTLVSRWAAVLALLVLLRRRYGLEPNWPRGLRAWCSRFEPARLREMLRLGLPAAGQLLFEVCAFTAAAVMMGWLGTKALAAHQIALSCCTLTFMFPLGLAMATSIRVSRAHGEGDAHALRRIGLSSVALALCFMLVPALAFTFLGEGLARLFVNDAAVTTLAGRLLIVAAIFQLCDGTQVVCSGALRGLSDVKVPTLITGVAYWLIAVPTSYLLGVHGVGATGVWWGLAAGLSFAAVALAWRLLRRTAHEF